MQGEGLREGRGATGVLVVFFVVGCMACMVVLYVSLTYMLYMLYGGGMVKKQMTIRVSEEELRVWREAAFLRRVSLSEWVRRVLSAMAASQGGGGDG